ncbi:MAG TPA: BON domain-containing protein [Nannocystaceae bacterium]|nr:BON domain-containing protein [Nannocystaceae bacterium]
MQVTRYLLTALVVFAASCDKKNDQTSAENKPADNTKKNERDRDDAAKTPGDQQENKQDIEITAAIRKGVVGDESLSMNAKNVKIITADGVVTLRGPVNSETEKTTIATLAQNTAGVQRVDNQLEIAAQ